MKLRPPTSTRTDNRFPYTTLVRAQSQIRAPLYEEKVVDFLLEKAEITDRNVTRAELEAAIEEEEGHVHGPGCGHDHDHDHAKPAKKPAAKAKAKKDDEAEQIGRAHV